MVHSTHNSTQSTWSKVPIIHIIPVIHSIYGPHGPVPIIPTIHCVLVYNPLYPQVECEEFLKFIQYDHSTNRLKMAKSLKRGQNFFSQSSHVGTLSRRANKPDGMQKELVHFDVLELRKRPKTVRKW